MGWTVLLYIFLFLSAIDILHFGFYLVGANFYDILQFRKAASKKTRSRQPRPLVSILVPAHNEEKAIIRCLESIRKNTYRKLEILVIDDASTDETRRLVRQYIADHPKRNIRLLYKRKNVGKAKALNHALRNAAKGELIMTLDADSMIHRKSISNAVAYFDDPKVVGVAANVRIMDTYSVLGLLQKFEHMVGYRSKKFYSIINSEFIVGGVASTYRASILRKVKFYDSDTVTEDIGLSLKVVALGNRENRIVYAANVLAMTEGVQSFKALLKQRYRWKLGSLQNLLKYRDLLWNRNRLYSRGLTFYRIPMAFFGELMLLLEPLAIAYIVYVCYLLLNFTMIAGAYLTITVYLLLTVWPDEHMTFRKKLQMSSYTPAMYFVFYLMNIVQLAAIARCIANYKQTLRKAAIGGHWVSPERHGSQNVQFS